MVKLQEFRVKRYFMIRLNEWVSLGDLSKYSNSVPSVTGKIVKRLDMDISTKTSPYGDIYYRYNVEEPTVPDYYEQIIYRYEKDKKIIPSLKSIAKQCLDFGYPETLLHTEPKDVLTLAIKNRVMNPISENTKRHYLYGIRVFLKWLGTKTNGYPEWFRPEMI